MALPAGTVDQVRRRANFACEYCGVTETDSAGQLTVDHFRPRAREGTDELTNLLYCCYRCNLYKAGYWPAQATDPALWNPRQESRETHLLALADGSLYPITATGRFTLDRLRLNRPALVEYRRRKQSQNEEAVVLRQLQELLTSLKQLHDRLKEAVEERRALLREQRVAMVRLTEGNGRQDGPPPIPGDGTTPGGSG
jgi:hypothetical protein